MYDTGHTDGLWLLMIFLHKSYLWYNKDCCCCCCCFCLVPIHRVAIIQEAYATATSKEGKEDGGLNIKYFKNTDVKGFARSRFPPPRFQNNRRVKSLKIEVSEGLP